MAGVKALWGLADRQELPSVRDLPPQTVEWGGWPRGGRPPYSRPHDFYLNGPCSSSSAAHASNALACDCASFSEYDFSGLNGAWRGHRLQVRQGTHIRLLFKLNLSQGPDQPYPHSRTTRTPSWMWACVSAGPRTGQAR